MRRVDLVGQRFGKLVAIEDIGSKYGARFWKCRCDCEKIAIVRASKLVSGHTTSCGCIKRINLVGKRFGRLVALEVIGSKNGRLIWRCKCDCGNYINVTVAQLNSQKTRSCGCLRRDDLTGQQFGRLIALEDVGGKNGKRVWKCKCECGKTSDVISTHLVSGNTKSCGCWQKESKIGINNFRWLGGISFEPYCPKFNEDLKRRIRSFYDHQCVLCGKTTKENRKLLDCHHVEYNKQACCDGEPVHFAAMCRSCHDRTRQDRIQWEAMIHRIIDEMYGGRSYYTKTEYQEMLKMY